MANVEETAIENDSENYDMPPPNLPTKPPDQAKIAKEESKSKPLSKEKKESVPELTYKEPSWSGIPDEFYNLEVLKNGCIITNVDLTSKPFHVFGRLPSCDVSLEHPSVSRYHAVIQYKTSDTSNSEKGFYLYDLGSTHGTFVNKSRLESKRYYRLRVGYVIKFGGSSRLFILQGPEDGEESDSNAAIQTEKQTEVRSSEVGRVMTEEEYEEWKKEREGGKQNEEDTGIDWGMGEDAVEEPAYPPDFGETEKAEEHHFKDPKKTLRGFFEREGLELEYDVEEKGPGHAKVFHCRVKLPIDGPSGDPLYAEAAITGRKKEAVLECAKEACRMLDAAGLLRQSSHESRKHKEKNWEENDFYDSDEDNFLDRTGSVEKKRIQRMKRAGKDQSTTETYESLTSKLQMLDDEISDCESRLKQDAGGRNGSMSGDADSLDDFMSSLGTSLDKTTRTQIRRKIFDLKKERQRLVKLVNIAKPANLPPVTEQALDTDLKKFSTESESKPTDSSSSKTADINTDSRHTFSAMPEEEKQTKRSADKEHLHEKVLRDNSQSHPTEQKEFAVPVLPALGGRKKNQQKKDVVVPSDSDKTVDVEETEKFGQEEDGESKLGTKRVNSDGGTELLEDDKNRTEENNEDIPKKRRKMKKRSYGVPTQWQADSDPSFTAWMPPEGQTGDGKTHLNEKFGY